MLIGYVSDHRYIALPEVSVLLEANGAAVAARSAADGSIRADLPAGEYHVALAKEGFGGKRAKIVAREGTPHHFRLLADTLIGYVWPKCVKAGEAGEFRVHSPVEYKLSLWRYGLEKQLALPIGWFDEHGPRATAQITPDGDYSQNGAQWNRHGYTSPHHKQFITAPQQSGLYYFHAESADEFFSFPWVVAPQQPQAKTAVLLADITWNAYNNFGGRSNYIHTDKLPAEPTLNARLELQRYTDKTHLNYDREDYAPLSFERPEPVNHIPDGTAATDPIVGRSGCHLAPAEWRMLAWLERERLDYDVYSETQLHFGDLDLDAYRVLILGPHPEYWSSAMYDRVKKWVHERGGRLMYLGGNGINCDVEFLDRQTCIYRNGDARRLKEKGGEFESRFHTRHESEANLLGVVYDPRGIMTAAPYQVKDDRHWLIADAGLRRGDIFGRRSLHERVPGGASGHETDKISPSSPTNVSVLAKGLNANGGGADLSFYETPSGGAVFSSGSICWTTSLLVDHDVSRITANVLRRFGA